MSKKANSGMTKNQKIAFGIGGVIIVAVLGYGLYRKYKYKKLKKQCEKHFRSSGFACSFACRQDAGFKN